MSTPIPIHDPGKDPGEINDPGEDPGKDPGEDPGMAELLHRSDSLRIIEALLFSSTDPLKESSMATHLNKDEDIRLLLEQLQKEYRNRGMHIVRIGKDQWAMRSAPDLARYLRITHQTKRRLSRAVMEILAICAYHQPITRREIEDMRGVAISSSSFDILLRLGWIKPSGRRRCPGRPLNWATTDAFLDHFGLQSLDDLPPVEELQRLDLLSSVEPEEDVPQEDVTKEDMSQEDMGNHPVDSFADPDSATRQIPNAAKILPIDTGE